ncbi:MAG TPA: hypothetical protein VK886_18805 [Vicinamibacterales bacterium]|nr:hypothetical protein [Vicinamibacterales bacterium]
MQRGLFTLLGVIGVVALLAAASTVWLVLQQPVAVADAISTGQYQPLMASLAREFADLFHALARLL